MNIIKSVTLVARTPGNVSHSDRGGFMSTKRFATCAAALVLLSGLVSAQQTVTQPGREMTVSGTIQEIDYTTRLVTLRRADGTDEIVYAPTSITRLNELKVGDRINTKYYESTILQLRRDANNGRTARSYSGAPGIDDCYGKGGGSSDSLDYGDDARRPYHRQESAASIEPRQRQGRRSDRYHLHGSGTDLCRTGAVNVQAFSTPRAWFCSDAECESLPSIGRRTRYEARYVFTVSQLVQPT
jgi:hypothetical protein